MANMRQKLAIICAKAAGAILRLTGRDGAAFPGLLADRIAPDILEYLAGSVREGIIVTMGTNGKTTTNNLLCHVLEAEGKKVVCNRSGANMKNGVTGAFVLAASLRGHLDADYACIEVDEFSAAALLPRLQPVCVVLTNIFRDQLDRYGEIDVVWEKMKTALESVPGAKRVINCDDSLLAALGGAADLDKSAASEKRENAHSLKGQTVTYGINERFLGAVSGQEVRDGTFCRFCGEKLFYAFRHYGQLGIYRCPRCGWKRPFPDYAAQEIRFCHGSYEFCVNGAPLRIHTDAPYHVYNTLSAYAALAACRADMEGFFGAVTRFDYENGREETFRIRGARVKLFLVKNPVGFAQKLSMMQKDGKPKDILIRIEDTARDGTDISWLWDVDFQRFAQLNAQTVLTAGSRRLDMALRLKYEDIACRAVKHVRRALWRLAGQGTGNLYVIVNYSGLQRMNRMLHGLCRWGLKKRERRRLI